MIRVGEISIPWGKSMFPDHTLLVKLDPEKMFDNRGAIKVEWLYEGDSELFTLICVKRHIDRHFYTSEVILDMPYIPHARMDRVKSDEDVFTLKYFAEIINSLNFKIVWVRDAHSNVSLALIDNVVDTGVKSYIHKAVELSGANAMFYPDEGAMKRYSDNSELPYAFGMKKRDWQTGKILGLDIINPENIVGILRKLALAVPGFQNELSQRYRCQDATLLLICRKQRTDLLDRIRLRQVLQDRGLCPATGISGSLQCLRHLLSQISHSCIHPVPRTGLIRKPPVNGQDHLPALRRIIQRLVLISEPDQLALAIALADIYT